MSSEFCFADLHIHSGYARACSEYSTLANFEMNAITKGLGLLGTGDALHSKHYQNIKSYLKYDEDTQLLEGPKGVKFMLTTEVSNRFDSMGVSKAIHNLILIPDFDTLDLVRVWFTRFSRTSTDKDWMELDGRPELRLNAGTMVSGLKDINPDIEVIPAHVWTSWFGVLGDSGFDSVEDCFDDATKYIFALETGLSSDPSTASKVTTDFTWVSFSDPHGPSTSRLGREATILSLKNITFKGVIEALKTRNGFVGTVEYPPEYGKYHLDGHRYIARDRDDDGLDIPGTGRPCGIETPNGFIKGIRLTPEEYDIVHGICPSCGSEMTLGVEHRIRDLSRGRNNYNSQLFFSVIPLKDLLESVFTPSKVKGYMTTLYKSFGTEYDILLNANIELISKVTDSRVGKLIQMNRDGLIKILPGYDNLYGEIVIGDSLG